MALKSVSGRNLRKLLGHGLVDFEEATSMDLKQCEEMLLKTGGKISAMVRSLGTPSLSVIETNEGDLAK